MDTNSRYDAVERFEPTARPTDAETFAAASRTERAPTTTSVYVECGSGWYHDAAIVGAREMHGHTYSM